MIFIKDQLREFIDGVLGKKFPKVKFAVKIEYPADRKYGDYATPVTFELSKSLGMSPRDTALDIVAALEKNLPDFIERIEMAGAGFINFFLAPKFATKFLKNIIDDGAKFGTSQGAKGLVAVTDTSHPNVAKPMGAHHLLSTIIGDALNKILAATGYKVVRDSYIGDWGTQFGKLIYAYKTWGDEAKIKANPIPELLKLYVKFHDEAEKDSKLEDAGRAEFKKLEDGDKENKKLWKWVVDLSLKEFYRLYDRLSIDFDVINGESFYEDKMQAIIDMGVKKGVFVEGEKGALIAPFDHEKYPPCIIKKSDGATLYATRDLARIKYWEETWHPDVMINVVDSAQSMHFKQLFEVSEKLGLTKAPNIHVVFGRMRFPEKKMSTRKGNILLLEDLLDEAEERAYKIVCEKNPDLSGKVRREVGRIVGIGAVKYAVLSQSRTTDITFTWDKILSLDGNSAPYLQYVYARAKSILRRAGDTGGRAGNARVGGTSTKYILKESRELALARLLPNFPEVVEFAAHELKPNHVANYLFNLAGKFNSFYAEVPVLKAGNEERAIRLQLVEAVSIVLRNGLALLGIEAPEEM